MKRNLKKKKSLSSQPSAPLKQLNLNAAGIDVGSTQLWVAVPEDRNEKPVQMFETFTADLHQMANWLKVCKIETVVMESTGVYWIPVFQILEAYGFDVNLVNAKHVKNVPGRKSDLLDCQWLQQLHTFGLLSGSFRPIDAVCVLRSYLRQRENLIQSAGAEIQRMQKALTQMNLLLHNVISDITGKTGMDIIRAILAGERDPKVLAQLKDPRIKSSRDRIAKSLEGDYREEHLFCLQQSVEQYEFIQRQLEALHQKIEEHLKRFEAKIDIQETPLPKPKNKNKRDKQGNAPKFELRSHLYQMTGVDLTQIEAINATSALIVVSEVGLDMSKFPNEKHFTSYLGISPNHQITGGKILKRKTRKIFNRAAQVLRMAAASLQRSSSYLGAFYRRMKSRLGPAKAITATARKLACQIYRMLKYGQDYVDRGEDFYNKRYQERIIKNLKQRAQELGFQMVQIPEFK